MGTDVRARAAVRSAIAARNWACDVVASAEQSGEEIATSVVANAISADNWRAIRTTGGLHRTSPTSTGRNYTAFR